jgi:hypothetical protein
MEKKNNSNGKSIPLKKVIMSEKVPKVFLSEHEFQFFKNLART